MAKKRHKIRLQITVKPELNEWLESEIKTGRFASKSHAIDRALTQLKEQIEKDNV